MKEKQEGRGGEGQVLIDVLCVVKSISSLARIHVSSLPESVSCCATVEQYGHWTTFSGANELWSHRDRLFVSHLDTRTHALSLNIEHMYLRSILL